MKNIRLLLLLSFSIGFFNAIGQYREGKILYERKTNLYKRMGDGASRWVEEKDKIKKEYFELTFTDSISLFQQKPTDIPDKMPWGTSRNMVYRTLRNDYYYSIRDIWGDAVHVEDSIPLRECKFTYSKRVIAGYNCRKALWVVNDSTTIHAWYAEEIIPSIGPERFAGLPGAILGLASEDGGVVYFAKEITFFQPKKEDFEFKRAKKTQDLESTREQIELVMSRNKWWKSDVGHFFLW
jgi:GLPGLI family protein